VHIIIIVFLLVTVFAQPIDKADQTGQQQDTKMPTMV